MTTFLPDVERIAAAITPRTRAIILNTPNNPTGRVYPESILRDLQTAARTRAASPSRSSATSRTSPSSMTGSGSPRWLRSSPTRRSATRGPSRSGLPGERIGYLALSPQLDGNAELRRACAFSNRILGFINAPAIWQWVMLEAADETIDAAPYEHKRNVLCDALEAIGYDVRRPEGSFYVFLKTPIADDVAFTRLLADEGVLAVPGAGFGRSGYIRLSLTIPLEQIEKSIPGFEQAFLAAIGQPV